MNPAAYCSRFLPLATSWSSTIHARFRASRGIFLTMDDGPHPLATPRSLDALARHGMTAAFFTVGQESERHPSILRDIRAAGHRVENHSYSHRRMHRSSNGEIDAEISRTDRLVADCTGVTPAYFRPPYGLFNLRLLRYLHLRGRRMLLWNRMPGEFLRHASARHIERYFIRTLREGDIVVLHDNDTTADRIAAVIDSFAAAARSKNLAPRPLPDVRTI